MGKGVSVAGWEAPLQPAGMLKPPPPNLLECSSLPLQTQEGSSFWRVETNGLETPLDRGVRS